MEGSSAPFVIPKVILASGGAFFFAKDGNPVWRFFFADTLLGTPGFSASQQPLSLNLSRKAPLNHLDEVQAKRKGAQWDGCIANVAVSTGLW